MRRLGSIASDVVRDRRRTSGRSPSSSPPSTSEVRTLRKRIAAAREAIVRDRQLNGMDIRIAWKTVDAINTDPTNPLFGYSWLSAEAIADWIGPDDNGRRCNEATIWRGRKRSIERGHIVCVRRGGRGVTDMYGLPPDLASSQSQDSPLTLRVRKPDLASSQGNPSYDPKDKSHGSKETAAEREQKRRKMRSVIDRFKAEVEP